MTNGNNNVEPPVREEEPAAVTLSYEAASRVNFASAQNDVAIIGRLAINNPTPEPLTDVRITLRSAPPIIREKVWTVDRIASESEFALRDISTPLDIERLAGLDEAEIGALEFRVETHGLPTIVEKCRVDLLARDEWGGVCDMGQILAAFVSPNDPAVAGRGEGRCASSRGRGPRRLDEWLSVQGPAPRIPSCCCHLVGRHRPRTDLRCAARLV